MKHASQIWFTKLRKENIPFKWVNIVHDEFVTEVPTMEAAQIVLDYQADSIREAGEMLNLRCPMAGVGGIGKTWLDIH